MNNIRKFEVLKMLTEQEICFIREVESRFNKMGHSIPCSYRKFMLNEYKADPELDIEYYFVFENRIKMLEDRIGYKLPDDFVEFYRTYDGVQVMNGEWMLLEEIELANQFDNYLMIEERPDLLSEEDCNHIIPLLVDNYSYVVMDLREDGKGVFVIWSDEEELAWQQPTLGEFIDNLKMEVKRAKEEGNDDFCFNYIDKYDNEY